MSRNADQFGSPSTDVDAVREALKQILSTDHYQLASPEVMGEVELIYQSLAGDGISLNDPGFLLPVYSTLGELAQAVKERRADRVHWSARALAAEFLLIAETSLEAQQHGQFGSEKHDTAILGEPPF